jgi:hypothetical protein
MACPGSPGIENLYPDTRRAEAGEGKLAHMAGAAILVGRDPKSLQNIDADAMAHIMAYVELCRALGVYDVLHVEEKFHSHYFNGVVDFWTFNPHESTLYIRDLKYGHGWVETYLNWQLLAYAFLILAQPTPAVKFINMGIYQPRGWHPQGPDRSWTISVEELEAYRAQMITNIENIYAGNVQTVSGPHCRYCKGLVPCHGATAAMYFAIDVAMRPGHETPTLDQVATDLVILERAIKLLEHKKAAYDQMAVELIRKGSIIPGWEVGQTPGKAQWKQGNQAVLDMGKMMGVDFAVPPAPITPTQAVNRKLIPEEAFTVLSERTGGAWKLRKINQEKIKELLK